MKLNPPPLRSIAILILLLAVFIAVGIFPFGLRAAAIPHYNKEETSQTANANANWKKIASE